MLFTLSGEEGATPPRRPKRFWTSPWFLLLLAAAVVPWAFIHFARSSPISISFNVPAGGHTIQRSGSGADEVAHVAIAGYYTARSQQGVALPQQGVLVALPADAKTISVTYEGVGPHFDYSIVQPNSQAAAGVFLPALAELKETSYFRNQRIGVVQISPVQYNAANGQLRYYDTVKVTVFVDGKVSSPLPLAPGLKDSPDFEGILSKVVINYEQGKQWRVRAAAPADLPTPELITAAAAGNAFKLQVSADGIYQVSFDDLQKAGLESNKRAATVSLWLEDKPVSFQNVSGETFGPGTSIRFFGQKSSSRYTDTNTYWLVLGGSTGERIPAAAPHAGAASESGVVTAHFEQNILYRSIVPRSDASDHWFWVFVQSLGGQESIKDLPFELPFLPDATQPAALALTMVGFPTGAATSDYRASASINGKPAGTWRWTGEEVQRLEGVIPAGTLRQGGNTLTLTIPKPAPVLVTREETNEDGTTRQVVEEQPGPVTDVLEFVDWFEVGATRTLSAEVGVLQFSGAGNRVYVSTGFSETPAAAYDVSDPLHPVSVATEFDGSRVRLSGQGTSTRRYFAVARSELRSPVVEHATALTLLGKEQGADYLIVAPAQFNAALEPLVAHYKGRGLRVRIVEPREIYATFAHGVPDPSAIRRFVQYASGAWQVPAPSYVLLAGDGTFDFKNYLGANEGNNVPPLLAQADPFLGETTVDNRFTTIVGEDPVPDLMIGRLPAQTAAQLEAMVRKILTQDARPTAASRPALFIGDVPDVAGDFHSFSDAIADELAASPYVVNKIYVTATSDTAEGTRKKIVAAWAQSPALVTFVGHAAVTGWSKKEFFTSADAAALPATNTVPVVLSLTCYDGYWDYPGLPSTSEILLRNPSGGASASFAASGLAVGTGHDILGRGFVTALLAKQPPAVGAAALLSKLDLYRTTDQFRDLLDTFSILGDPGMRVP